MSVLVYIIPAYIVFFVAMLFFLVFRHRGKIKVRVKTALEEYTKWGTPTNDRKHVIVKFGKLGKEEWKIKISSVLIVKKWLFGTYKAIDVFAEAVESITYKYDTEETKQPHWDKQQSKKFINAKVLETYSRGEDNKRNNRLMIMIILQVAMLVIILYALRGLILG